MSLNDSQKQSLDFSEIINSSENLTDEQFQIFVEFYVDGKITSKSSLVNACEKLGIEAKALQRYIYGDGATASQIDGIIGGGTFLKFKEKTGIDKIMESLEDVELRFVMKVDSIYFRTLNGNFLKGSCGQSVGETLNNFCKDLFGDNFMKRNGVPRHGCNWENILEGKIAAKISDKISIEKIPCDFPKDTKSGCILTYDAIPGNKYGHVEYKVGDKYCSWEDRDYATGSKSKLQSGDPDHYKKITGFSGCYIIKAA